MTLTVRSDAGAVPFGSSNIHKWGLNATHVEWDGAGSGVVVIDARALYRNGNNMAVAFNFESGATATCLVEGCSFPVYQGIPAAEIAAYPWTTIVTLNNTTRYFMDSPAVRMSLRLTFGVARGRVSMVRG